MATLTVIGNIGDEPSLRFTPSGTPALGFSLAENHRKRDSSGEWQDDGATWRRITVWGDKAEHWAEQLKKGDRILVTGQERLKEFETRDGGKGKSLELNAQQIGLIPKFSTQQGQQQGQGGFAQSTQANDPWGQQAPPQGQQGGWGESWGQPDSPPPF